MEAGGGRAGVLGGERNRPSKSESFVCSGVEGGVCVRGECVGW